MKKYKYKNIISLLSLGTLIAGNSGHAITFGENGENEIQASVGFYKETDRISVFKSVFDYKRKLDTDENVSIRLSIDSLTGSTPSGAIASVIPQSLTSPSGNSFNHTDAYDIPKDKFEDTRYSISANYDNQLSSDFKYNVGANLSSESDYLSISGNFGLSLDFNNKNTTLSLLSSYAFDTINAEGGIPYPYSYMNNPIACIIPKDDDDDAACEPITPSIPYGDNKTNQSKYKTTGDVLLGLTQVVNQWSLLGINYFASISHGYHNDPYKVISIVDDNGNPVIADSATNLSKVMYENRPNYRVKQGIYAEYKATIFQDNIPSIAYRYSFDDWSVRSHAVEFKYFTPIVNNYFIQPYVRLYSQSAAFFYTPYLTELQADDIINNHTYASSDNRLANMQSYSMGLEFGIQNNIPWSILIEYYHQSFDEPYKYGSMKNITINKDVNAFLVMLNVKL